MKKIISLLLILVMLFSLAACGKKEESQPEPEATEAVTEPTEELESKTISVYSMKGPTSMGLVKLYDDNRNGKSENIYEFNVVTAADEVTSAIVSGKADIAMLPANAAATLYNKAGGFKVAAINTLGVLYVVENGESIQSFSDLEGKTVYLTGKGTTPEYAMRFLMGAYGIEDVTLEFLSEATEVVTALSNDTAAIGVLPQPFVTSALMQNQALRKALSLTDCWAEIADDSAMVTGVTLISERFMAEYPELVESFMEEYKASVDYVNANTEESAKWIEELGIVAKAPIAQKALPDCNLVCISGEEMQTYLSGYLQTLFDSEPKAVGGSMPAEGFYYIPDLQ